MKKQLQKKVVIGALLSLSLLSGTLVMTTRASETRSQTERDSSIQQSFTDLFPDPVLADFAAQNFGRLTTDHVTLEELSTVRYLHLIDSSISDLTGIGYLTGLKTLEIRNADLTEIPSEIGNLAHLQHLQIIHTAITELPREIGNFEHLHTLELNDNKLTKLPAEIGDLTRMRYLTLSRNELTEIPAELGNAEMLLGLLLDSNQLTSLPDEISTMNINDIWLDHNLISQLPANFDQLPLQHFTMTDNKLISPVPDHFFSGNGYFDLRIQENGLDSLEMEQGSSVSFINFIPPFVQQLQNFSSNELTGSWVITQPDQTQVEIAANDGSEMSQFVFDQAGDYKVEYYSATHVESTPSNLKIGDLHYITLLQTQLKESEYKTVTYDINGGYLVSGADFEEVIMNGCPSNVPTVSHSKLKFIGWMDENGNIVDPATVVITQDTTFMAQYKAVEYVTVKYNAGTGFIISGNSSESVEKGEKPSKIPTVMNPFGKFLGWKDRNGNIVNPVDIAVISNTTYTAFYDIKEQ